MLYAYIFYIIYVVKLSTTCMLYDIICLMHKKITVLLILAEDALCNFTKDSEM